MQIKTRPATTYAVTNYQLPENQTLRPAARMCAAREANFIHHALNLEQNGASYYLVESPDDHDTITLPAGQYATFVMARANQWAMDAFIQAAYRQLANSPWQPTAQCSLESLDANFFTLAIPVAKRALA